MQMLEVILFLQGRGGVHFPWNIFLYYTGYRFAMIATDKCGYIQT